MLISSQVLHTPSNAANLTPGSLFVSEDLTDFSDQSTEREGSPEEGSIVDMLLADVRSGFCNRKYAEGNFNVTKVQKISLDPSGLAAALTAGTGDALSAHDMDAAKPSGAAAAEGAVDTKDFVRGGYGRVSLLGVWVTAGFVGLCLECGSLLRLWVAARSVVHC